MRTNFPNPASGSPHEATIAGGLSRAQTQAQSAFLVAISEEKSPRSFSLTRGGSRCCAAGFEFFFSSFGSASANPVGTHRVVPRALIRARLFLKRVSLRPLRCKRGFSEVAPAPFSRAGIERPRHAGRTSGSPLRVPRSSISISSTAIYIGIRNNTERETLYEIFSVLALAIQALGI